MTLREGRGGYVFNVTMMLSVQFSFGDAPLVPLLLYLDATVPFFWYMYPILFLMLEPCYPFNNIPSMRYELKANGGGGWGGGGGGGVTWGENLLAESYCKHTPSNLAVVISIQTVYSLDLDCKAARYGNGTESQFEGLPKLTVPIFQFRS